MAWEGVHRLLGPQSSGKALLVNEALVTSAFWPRDWGQAHMSSTHIKNGAEQSVGKRMRTASQQAAQGQGASAPLRHSSGELCHSQGTHRAHLGNLGPELPARASVTTRVRLWLMSQVTDAWSDCPPCFLLGPLTPQNIPELSSIRWLL